MGEEECPARPSQSQGILSNFLSLVLASVSVQIVNFCYQAYAAGHLGPESFGLFAFIIAVVSVAGVVVGLGLAPVVTRETAISDADRAHHVVQAASLIHLTLACTAAALICSVAWYVPRFHAHFLYALLAALTMVLEAPNAIVTAYFRGVRQMGIPSLALLLRVAGKAAIGVGLLLSGFSLVSLFWALALSSALSTVFLVGAYYKRARFWPVPALRNEGKLLARDGGQILLSQLTNVAFNRFDWIFLGSIISSTVLGTYSVAYRLFEVLMHVPGNLAVSAFPLLCKSAGQGKTNQSHLLLAMKCAVLPGCVFCIFLCFWAEPFLLLVLGPSYLGAVGPLQILGMALPFHGGCAILYHVAIARRRQQYLVWSSGSCAACNILLCVCLIPTWGATGAATAMLIPSVVQLFLLALLAQETGRLLPVVGYGMRVAAIVGVLAISVFATPLPWPVEVCVAAVIVVPALWQYGGIRSDEKRLLRQVWRNFVNRSRPAEARSTEMDSGALCNDRPSPCQHGLAPEPGQGPKRG